MLLDVAITELDREELLELVLELEEEVLVACPYTIGEALVAIIELEDVLLLVVVTETG